MFSGVATSSLHLGPRVFRISVLCLPANDFNSVLLKLLTALASSFNIITEPAGNVPETEIIPLGSRLFRFLSAFIAPASILTVPAGPLLSIHRVLLLSFLFGIKTVPIGAPATILRITFLVLPLARTILHPE